MLIFDFLCSPQHPRFSLLGLPVTFCLLPNRKGSTYTELFDRLKEQATAMNKQFNPKRIISDFEPGLVAVIKHEVSVRLRHAIQWDFNIITPSFSFRVSFIRDVYSTLPRLFIVKSQIWVWLLIIHKMKLFVVNVVS